MALYAIGDVQGCDRTLGRVLERIRFHPSRDRLWFVGDLVNRGPRSLQVLRRVRGLGERATVVLGNHDLHLLARGAGVLPPRPGDTLGPVLEAEDATDLLAWLGDRPLLHRDDGRILVHAGLLPDWTAVQAEAAARSAAEALRGPDGTALLRALHAEPDPGRPEEFRRALADLRVLTRLRYCDPEGRPRSGFKGPPAAAPAGHIPWFQVPGRRTAKHTVVFGHWAALGLHLEDGVMGLDTGCVWGGALTAVRLDDGAVFREPHADGAALASDA